MSELEAIILAGGRGSRMGGIAKPMLELSGRTLLQRTVDAARTAASAGIAVVGPPAADIDGVRWVREEPPFGGPAAGLAAALPGVAAPWVLVLPADLVFPHAAATALMATTRAPDGVCLADEDARPQWLTGIYRTAALRDRVAASAPLTGASARSLLSGLDVSRHFAGADAAADIDTWEHLGEARRRGSTETEHVLTDSSPRTLPPEALDAWAAALRERFGLSEEDLPIGLILDLARDVAGAVARPAAPFSAYAAGLVAGRAGGSPEQVRQAVAEVTRLAQEWESR